MKLAETVGDTKSRLVPRCLLEIDGQGLSHDGWMNNHKGKSSEDFQSVPKSQKIIKTGEKLR